MSEPTEADDPVYARLRRVRPDSVWAILHGREPHRLDTSGTKGRWERAIRAALALDADALELRNAEDAIIEVVPLREEEPRPAAPAQAAEAAPSLELGELRPRDRSVATLLGLELDAVERMTDKFAGHLHGILDHQAQVMREQAQTISELRAELADRDRERAKLIASQAGGGGSQSDELMQQLLVALAARGEGGLGGLLAGGSRLLGGKPPTNGKGGEG